MGLRLLVGGLRLLFNLALMLIVAFALGFLTFINAIDREQREPTETADGIAVLTGGKARIDEAMKLLSDRKAKRLLITGVHRDTSKEALKQLAAYGEELFACCVDLDKEAQNTIDNATETSQWVAKHRYRSIIVVTSNYHMPRALAELGRVMPSVGLVPYPVVVNPARLAHWRQDPSFAKVIVREYVKVLPAVGRLGATQLVSKVLTGTTTAPVEDASEP